MSKLTYQIPPRTVARAQSRFRPKDFGNIEIIGDDKKLEVLQRVRAGDPTAINQMIMSHIRLVLLLVNRHLHNCPHYGYDLDSVAMLGVVNCVHKIANGAMANHDNITGYITKHIHGLIQREIGKSHIVPTPRSVPNIVTTNHGTLGYRTNADGDMAIIDLRDALEHLVENRRERRILELREKGYTDQEVGEILGISQWTVRLIRLELYRRYRQQQKEENE